MHRRGPYSQSSAWAPVAATTRRATPSRRPCHNYGRFLAEGVESVLHQSHSDLEIIIVDDGSTDNTAEVASM